MLQIEAKGWRQAVLLAAPATAGGGGRAKRPLTGRRCGYEEAVAGTPRHFPTRWRRSELHLVAQSAVAVPPRGSSSRRVGSQGSENGQGGKEPGKNPFLFWQPFVSRT